MAAPVAKVVISASDRQGLGLCFPASWGRTARFLNSENTSVAGQTGQEVVTAKWSAIRHTAKGQDQMVAVIGPPQDKSQLTRFFCRSEPDAFVSANPFLEEGKLEYMPGDEFGVDYLIAVYSDIKSGEFLNARFRARETEPLR